MPRLTINSKTTGKFTVSTINGREHLVAKMRPIEGDSVMNRLLYPTAEVKAAYTQLDDIPAPAGHPVVEGRDVSAYNPLANNAYSFGAFVRNPEMTGNEVTTDLAIDLEVASRTEAGQEVVNRIKSGQKIGVSTGLTAEVINKKGGKGRAKYDGVINGIQFDHVAVLLDAEPAGENTYTLNKKRSNKIMDEITIDLSALALADRQRLAAMSQTQLINALTKGPSLDDAKEIVSGAGLHINATAPRFLNEYIENKEEFAAYKNSIKEARQEKIDFVLANSKEFTAEDLADVAPAMLDKIVDTVTPTNDYQANGQTVNNDLELLDFNTLGKEA